METNAILSINKQGWERNAHRFFGRTALPDYGPFSPSEEQLQLFGSVFQQKILDIGCGSGHSLEYMGNRGAKELWGIDLTTKQIETAKQLLQEQTAKVSLLESPMEVDPGLPKNYFDIAYSIYALGWTVNLHQTLGNIYSYLKPGGIFVFSWEHPMHDRIAYEQSSFIVNKSYNMEGPEYNEAWHNEVVISHRKLSTYINTLIDTGFIIEKVFDDVQLPENVEADDPARWYSSQKASFVPATFIIKAKKKEENN